MNVGHLVCVGVSGGSIDFTQSEVEKVLGKRVKVINHILTRASPEAHLKIASLYHSPWGLHSLVWSSKTCKRQTHTQNPVSVTPSLGL